MGASPGPSDHQDGGRRGAERGHLEVPRVFFVTWPLPQPPLFCGRDCGGDLEMLDPLTVQILWGGGKRASIPDVIKLDMVNYV